MNEDPSEDTQMPIEEIPIDESEAADIRLSRDQIRRGEVTDWRRASGAIFGATDAQPV